MTTKNFHIGDFLSITDGKLVSPDHIDGVYRILNWMTSDNLSTHQLPRAMDECRPSLLKQNPELAAVVVPDGIASREAAVGFLETLYPKFGQTVPVTPLSESDHTVINPIAEIRMMRPDISVIEA